MHPHINHNNPFHQYLPLFKYQPDAVAIIEGSNEYPAIQGEVRFCQTEHGVLIGANIYGLPHNKTFLGFHIHEGTSCNDSTEDPFPLTKGHYNPFMKEHPKHAGDLPPLLVTDDGYAFSIFLTNSFAIEDIIGRTIVIHSMADDFTTQPAGNSGVKIACGQIKSF